MPKLKTKCKKRLIKKRMNEQNFHKSANGYKNTLMPKKWSYPLLEQ